MNIKSFLLKIGSGIAVFFSALFYVLFQVKKEENRKLKEEQQKEEIKRLEEEKTIIEQVNKKNIEERKAHEELYNTAISDNGDAGFNAGIQLLLQLREEGKRRNNI